MKGGQKPGASTLKKVDNQKIAEDFKKYEDKTTKKIKPGKNIYKKIINLFLTKILLKKWE